MRRLSTRLTALLLILLPAFAAGRPARDTLALALSLPDSLTDAYLDTVNVSRKAAINDYTLIGFYAGPSLNFVDFNPSKHREMLVRPANFGLVWTRYGKMFGYMPYFGIQASIGYGQDGYRIKVPKTGYPQVVDGYIAARYQYVEAAAMGHMHIDIGNNFKIMANLGLYGAYRLNVQREMAEGWSIYSFDVTDAYKPAAKEDTVYDKDYVATRHLDSFYPFENRWDYGIKGGVGFGLMFDPVEIHINAHLRYGFGSLYEPDYYSRYYYRFAYPIDVVISAGIHFQLTKRRGKTSAQLRKEARDLVYGTPGKYIGKTQIVINE